MKNTWQQLNPWNKIGLVALVAILCMGALTGAQFMEAIVIGGGYDDADGGADIGDDGVFRTNGTVYADGNITSEGTISGGISVSGSIALGDDETIDFGDAAPDIDVSWDSGNSRLEWTDGTNILAHLTDNGTTGVVTATGSLVAPTISATTAVGLVNDIPVLFGSSNEFNLSYDSGNTRLEWTDGTNVLLHLTDGGTTGDLNVTGALTLGTTLTVPNGGTGVTTLTDGGILLGSGTGAITALGVATNGQIPIGDGTTDPVLATLTGTASEVEITNGVGSITVGLPDDVTLVGDLAVNGDDITSDGTLTINAVSDLNLKDIVDLVPASDTAIHIRGMNSADAAARWFAGLSSGSSYLTLRNSSAASTITLVSNGESAFVNDLQAGGANFDLGDTAAESITTDVGEGTGDWTINADSVTVSGDFTVGNVFELPVGTQFTDDDTTPSVGAGNMFQLASAADALSVTDLDNGHAGHVVRLIAVDSNTTLVDGGDLNLNANWTPTAGDTITVGTLDGSTWYEMGRSNND